MQQPSNRSETLTAADATDNLVERVCRGEVAALETLYRQHHEAVRAFARRFLGDRDLAEDLLHDVFLSAPSALEGYRGQAALRTFLISVAVNKSKHYLRSAGRRRGMLERFAARPMGTAQSSAPDEDFERRELAAELQRALDRLPIDERAVVILCEVEERTSAEAAQIVNAPEATVRTRLSRARKRLRAMLGGEP